MKRTAKKSRVAQNPTEGDDNLRRGTECHTLTHQVPQLLSDQADQAHHALAEIQGADVPKYVRQDVTAAASSVVIHLQQLSEHVARGEIGGAVLAAYEVGRSSQMIARLGFTHLIVIGSRSRNVGREHAAGVADRRRQRYADIRVYVVNRQEKRRHKTPSDTQIYQEAAEHFGVSVPTVRRACGKK